MTNAKVIGMRIEKYIGSKVEGHNCDFQYTDTEFERHIICIIEGTSKFEVTLYESQGECGSGWTTASWGNMEVKQVEKFNGFTWRPKQNMRIENFSELCKQFDENDNTYTNFTDINTGQTIFTCSQDGGCQYYPSGGYSVNLELFTQTIRHKQNRPVWIFKGKSNAGKSFLASHLKDMSVYETDSSEVLPEKIKSDVIVMGNKYDFTLDEIKNRIFGNAEIKIVEFL